MWKRRYSPVWKDDSSFGFRFDLGNAKWTFSGYPTMEDDDLQQRDHSGYFHWEDGFYSLLRDEIKMWTVAVVSWHFLWSPPDSYEQFRNDWRQIRSFGKVRENVWDVRALVCNTPNYMQVTCCRRRSKIVSEVVDAEIYRCGADN